MKGGYLASVSFLVGLRPLVLSRASGPGAG